MPDDEAPLTPLVTMGATTLVYDITTGCELLRLNGRVVLPLGAELELVDPPLVATVQRVCLAAGGGDDWARVSLGVKVQDSAATGCGRELAQSA